VKPPRATSQTYDSILAAIYGKCFPGDSGKATVIDLMGDGSGVDETGRAKFDGEDRVMSES